jgi:hypothetical protein
MVVADAEQAELRTENARMRHELEVMYGGAFDMPPTAAPAVDRTDLRDRIAEAIHGDLLAHAARRDQGLLGIVPRLTDAVLAVLPEPADRGAVLLRDAESYLSALHGSVARHDNLAANLGCAGCELRDQIRDELRRMADEAQQPGSPS